MPGSRSGRAALGACRGAWTHRDRPSRSPRQALDLADVAVVARQCRSPLCRRSSYGRTPMPRSSRRSRRARAKPSATATTTGTASRPPRREVDRMFREWRAEADATRDWPTCSATASRCSAISHARSARRRAKPCSPMSRASPAKPFRHLLPLFLDAPIGEPYLEPVLSVGIERIHFGQRQTLEIFSPPDADWSCPPRRPRRLSCRRSNAAGCRT
jgi:hypothetical protein